MPVISSPRKFHLANGGRPIVTSGDPKRIAGPFRIPITVSNGTPMAVDLTLRGSWAQERRVAKAYAITSTSDTARLDATLWLEAVRIRFTGDLSQVTGASKAKLFAPSTEPYLSGLIGGIEFRQLFAFDEVLKPVAFVDSDLATSTSIVVLNQGPRKLPGGARVYFGGDSLSLISDAAVALGADQPAHLELYGTLHPGALPSVHPGATACAVDDGGDGEAADEVAAARVATINVNALYPGI